MKHMKMIIQKEDLLYAVNAVEKAVSGKNTLPILNSILISAEAGRAIFRATDMELAVECVVNAETEVSGVIATPGKKLAQLVRLLPNGPVEILTSQGGQQLELVYGKSRAFVPMMPPEEFPLLPEPRESDGCFRAPAVVFRRLIRQVAIAAAADELRPVFTGVLVIFNQDSVEMVATDTHRLARGKGLAMGEGQASLLLPGRVLQEVARLAVNDDEQIVVRAGQNQAFFSFANLTFASRLIMGQYPDYQQVIPKEELFVTEMAADKRGLMDSLERAALISQNASQKNHTVCLSLEEQGCRISAETPDEGRINEELPAMVSGQLFEINYNVRYLLDALKVIDGEQVRLRFTGPNTPGVILPEGEDQQYLYLLLPIRVGR